MSGWGEYLLAWVLFLASHAIPVRPPVRARLVALCGRRAYLLAYSAVSLLLLYWLLRAAGRAPFVALWPMPAFVPWLVLAAMLAAAAVMALALGRPNPFSFGGTAAPFDPANAGILRLTRHPILLTVLLWSLAHLLANGDLAHVLLFGGFALVALLGMHMLDRRNRSRMGAPAWQAAGRGLRFGHVPHLGLRLTGALAAVAALVALHPAFAGVAIAHWFH